MTTYGDDAKQPEMTRRRMLMRLGLAATAIYTAPVLLQLSDARASGFSRKSVSFSRAHRSGKPRGAAKAHGKPVRTTSRRKTRYRRRRRHIKSFS